MESGKFISVEGIEGVGKSTNIDVLVKCFEEAGHKVLTTREPGGTPFAEDIREILMNRSDEPVPEIAELLLMFAARSFNVNNVIVPALEAGTWARNLMAASLSPDPVIQAQRRAALINQQGATT